MFCNLTNQVDLSHHLRFDSRGDYSGGARFECVCRETATPVYFFSRTVAVVVTPVCGD